jgi:hypothetical protein
VLPSPAAAAKLFLSRHQQPWPIKVSTSAVFSEVTTKNVRRRDRLKVTISLSFKNHSKLESRTSTMLWLVNRDRKLSEWEAKVVAGNVTQAGLINNISDAKASRQALRPDEVLFKQVNAPVRYEETDYYFAHEKLPANQRLPSAELLDALHGYVSTLYSRTGSTDVGKAWKCMDETALIALGILMEETVREVLGETGDLAFTEAADEEEERALASQGEDAEQDGQDGEFTVEEARERPATVISSDEGSDYSTDETD